MRVEKSQVVLMRQFARRSTWEHLPRWWQCKCQSKKWLIVLALLLALGYGSWPYVTLWQLNQALLHNEQVTLTALIDVDAVRDAIRRRLNKDETSPIAEISDNFINWLGAGIRYHGVAVLEKLITREWIREQLQARMTTEGGFLPALTASSFVNWRTFQVQIVSEKMPPLILGLQLDTHGWRVAMLSY
ncbi:DUF2939 domain-containing protein [Chromatium okenii]|jgi:hypothetical protein|nr:DUF2939 domain-containing protein [Chromatium okenii]